MANSDLHPLLKSINETIGRLREDVKEATGEIEKVHTVLDEGFRSLRDAIHENIQAQAEMKLMEYVSEVHSIKPQIEAERQQIVEEKEELDEALESIADRYREKHDDLDEKAERRVRDLGEHIFEIDEEEFERGVEDPFLEHVTTTWDDLREHNERADERRDDALRTTLDDARGAIQEFVDRRGDLLQRIDDHRTDLPTGGGTEARIDVPYYVVTVVEDGVEREVVVPPSRLVGTDDDWLPVDLEAMPGFREPVERIADRPLHDPSTIRLPAEQLADAMAVHGERRLAGQVSYADAFADALPDHVPIRRAVD